LTMSMVAPVFVQVFAKLLRFLTHI